MSRNYCPGGLVDLHTHTTASDGHYSASEVVKLAASEGVGLLSITDHDSVEAVGEGRRAAESIGMGFIPGVELSASGDKMMHILGYHVDTENKQLRELCEWLIDGRDERKYKIVEYLKGRGVSISLERVEELAEGGAVGRPHFARVMLECGYVSTIKEAFEKHLATPEFDSIERQKPTPEHAIQVIKNAGGAAVLAHPLTLRVSIYELEDTILELKRCGLVGMECYYSTHTYMHVAALKDLAFRHNLVVTGGSDFHGGGVKPDVYVGVGKGTMSFTDLNVSKKLKAVSG